MPASGGAIAGDITSRSEGNPHVPGPRTVEAPTPDSLGINETQADPPLPKRHGLDPARLRLPDDGAWATIRDHLVERLPGSTPTRINELLAAGGIVDLDGPIAPDAPYAPGGAVWFHRDLPDETEVPFDIAIVHRDEHLLVVDKPHFLATIPRGSTSLQTALVRLRRELACRT